VIVPVWALRTAIAFSLGIDKTSVWLVAFTVRLSPRELFEHLTTGRGRLPIIQLILTPPELRPRQKSTRSKLKGHAPWPPGSAHSNLLAIERYFRNNDLVARKILARHAEQQGLKPPEDESVVRPACSVICRYSCPHELRLQQRIPSAYTLSSHYLV
jgi:hypothetical protein